MTLRMNRAGRMFERRLGALARLSNRKDDTPERRKAIDAETLALHERTARKPGIIFTRKKLATASAARKLRRAGKLPR